jgi:hypothetical protein
MVHWIAVLLTGYAVGFVEFWRLCDAAPSMQDASDNTAA